MADLDQSEIVEPQRQVQRLLGRCLLRLQQYERLLKGMFTAQELSGTDQTLPHALKAREAEVSDKTLGTLMRRMLRSYFVPEGNEPPIHEQDLGDARVHVHFHMQLNLPLDTYEKLSTDLHELVTLRNNLVHHFIDQHDLWTVDGCFSAQNALTHTYAEIDRHFEQLRTYADYMVEASQKAAEFMGTPAFLDMAVNGIAPDGTIHWPMAGIVSALKNAARELTVDGWVNLDAAARWVSERHPDQTPQKYGCSRWRHVVHESGQFELRRFTHNGQFGGWFRDRPVPTEY